jgi:hypothetical protein
MEVHKHLTTAVCPKQENDRKQQKENKQIMNQTIRLIKLLVTVVNV